LWIGWSYCGEVLLWVAGVLTFITGYQYYQRSLEYVKAENSKEGKTVKATDKVEAVIQEAAKPAKKTTAPKASKKVATAKKPTAKKTAAKKTAKKSGSTSKKATKSSAAKA
jgi:hypothetical protein